MAAGHRLADQSRPRVVSFTQSAVSEDEILKGARLQIEEWINIARAESADHA